MNDKIKKLLKGAGFSDDVITAAEKEDKDFDIQQAIESNNEAQKEHYKSLLENEIKDEVRDEALKSSEGKVLGLVNHELKKLGVPLAEIQDLPLKEKIKKATDYFKDEVQKSAGKTNEDFKVLQEENLKLKNELSEKEDWMPKTEIENERQKLLAERKAEKIDSEFQKRFKNIPPEKLIFKEHNEGAYNGLRTYTDQRYDIDYDKDEVVIMPKGSKTRATSKNAEGREVFKSADDVILEGLKHYKWLVESNGNGGEGQRDQNSGEQGGENAKPKSARLLEMENKIKAEQTA